MNDKKHEVTIGFDLGVGSVGWAVIDNNTNEILKLGSRLFSEPELATDRRAARSSRRLLRRRKYRNEKFINMLFRYQDFFKFESKKDIYDTFRKLSNKYQNILDLKIKALRNQVSPKELSWLLHDYLENRGFFYTIIENESDKNNNDDNKSKAILAKNEKLLPTELLYKFYEKNGFYKNQDNFASEYSRSFSNLDWIKELNQVFDNYPEKVISAIKNDFLNLFSTIRPFNVGPGSQNSPTKYGLYQKNNDGHIEKIGDSIWEKNIGRCSVFVDQPRAPKHTASSEIFNLLNDMNNLINSAFVDFKLSEENKIELLNTLLNKYKDITSAKTRITNFNISMLKNILLDYSKNKGIDDSWLQMKNLGFGVAKNKTYELNFSELKNIFYITQILARGNANLDIISFPNYELWINDYDEIVTELSKTQDLNQRIELLSKLKFWNKYFETEDLKEDAIKNLSSSEKIISSQMSSLSTKCHLYFIPSLLKYSDNFERIKFNDENLQKANETNIQNKKYLSQAFLDDAILPPSVRTTMKEAVSVFNKIKKLYSDIYDIKNVTVELAREKNSDEVRKQISQLNNSNKKRNNSIETNISKLLNKNIDLNSSKFSNNLKYKLFLYLQQEHIDPYDGKELDLELIINDPSYVEIDHIIPYSWSMDDSSSNKVLTKRTNNQVKGQNIPFNYFKKLNSSQWNWIMYKEWCDKLFLHNKDDSWFPSKKSKSDKHNKLLVSKFDENDQKTFMARNLNDTRYATKIFRDTLQNYSKNHDNEFKVTCINGSITSYIRKISKIGLKDRNDFSHHAVDATIISLISNNTKTLFNELFLDDTKYELVSLNGILYKENMLTGVLKEVSNSKELKKLYDSKKIAQIVKNSLENRKVDFQFSRKIITKSNVKLFNDTLYGLKENSLDNSSINKITYIKLIDEKNKDKNLKDYFGENAPKASKLLMCNSHKSEYKILNDIYMKYQDHKNPFIEYMYNDLLINFPETFTKEKIDTLVNFGKIAIYNYETKTIKIYKKLRLIGDSYKKDNIVMNKKQNNKSFNESLNWIGGLVYKNKKNNYSLIVANSQILKMTGKNINLLDESVYDQESLDSKKEQFNIELSEKPVLVLKKGTIFMDEQNELYHTVGLVPSNQTIEISKIKDNLDNKRLIKSINVLMKNYKIVELDVLGNVYKKTH
ncbi:type II CRISPR RNA-guided endonuclease Cas9 [Mycoplasma sp. Mirounga ES2805-ORL]|uniref:type II CRISPR RNA-guided endonuclease Cas9 n=1 Tax=Mycoplasma sp. Mirounga ES2805-ORL TaxID=754514 RepID=UPI00197B111E|nr:type II CRISPR RNA-guided endonuclease Cas9 [Mycoplasma sp. Mirounga ES2805-ORL]QSF13704.1 type II CRISPR RNA-guided endonuclease Cas9 [Mycoplasma sp. Mirounga ES2805-ORL]